MQAILTEIFMDKIGTFDLQLLVVLHGAIFTVRDTLFVLEVILA